MNPRLSLILLLAVLGLAGCGPSSPSGPRGARPIDTSAEDEGANFINAVEVLEHADEYGAARAQQRALRNFEQWIARQEEIAWQREPMLENLPKELKPWAEAARLEELRFELSDMAYFSEMIWLRNVTRWAADKPPASQAMQEFLAEVKKDKGPEVATELATAERLFDWTIRNIQIEPMPEGGVNTVVGGIGPELPGQKVQGAAKAVLIPGARYFPGEAIVLGQGDALVRARVFINLLRQRQIDAVLLALSSSKSESAQPWAVGVFLGGDLYLFDTFVGLPVLGPGGRGVATWKQIQADPSLLRQMDLSDKEKYPVDAADLGGTVAWIDADPVALSKRMKMIEAKLSGQQRTVLTTDPTRLKKSLMAAKLGLVDVRLWTAPIHAYIYKRRLENDKQGGRAQAEMAYKINGILSHLLSRYTTFDQRFLEEGRESNEFFQGRIRHLAGDLSGTDHNGAKQCYLHVRRTQGFLSALDAAGKQELAQMVPEVQAILAANPHYFDDDRVFNAYKAQLREFLSYLTLRGTYWMSIAAFDAGDYEVAATHLQTRLLDELGENEFTPSTRYNLARAYEQAGNYDKAREILFQDIWAPQKYGTELRARLLPEK